MQYTLISLNDDQSILTGIGIEKANDDYGLRRFPLLNISDNILDKYLNHTKRFNQFDAIEVPVFTFGKWYTSSHCEDDIQEDVEESCRMYSDKSRITYEFIKSNINRFAEKQIEYLSKNYMLDEKIVLSIFEQYKYLV